MLTLKKVKEMVKAPVHTKRVPSPKVLLEDGRILLRKEFEHDSHLTLYHSGYVWFSTGKRNTVFHIHDCCGNYVYDAAEGKGDVIEEEYFENCEWHIRALFEGERRVEESQQKCEGVGQTKVCVSYHAVAEDWGEMVDSEINVLDERDRKGSIQTTQEVEIYFNFVGRFVPPAFGEVELTPEELEEIRKREERKDRLHQNYLKRKANGKQKEYEERTKAKKKAEIEARKQAIRTEDIARGVFIPVSSLPQLGPRKGA